MRSLRCGCCEDALHHKLWQSLNNKTSTPRRDRGKRTHEQAVQECAHSRSCLRSSSFATNEATNSVCKTKRLAAARNASSLPGTYCTQNKNIQDCGGLCGEMALRRSYRRGARARSLKLTPRGAACRHRLVRHLRSCYQRLLLNAHGSATANSSSFLATSVLVLPSVLPASLRLPLSKFERS